MRNFESMTAHSTTSLQSLLAYWSASWSLFSFFRICSSRLSDCLPSLGLTSVLHHPRSITTSIMRAWYWASYSWWSHPIHRILLGGKWTNRNVAKTPDVRLQIHAELHEPILEGMKKNKEQDRHHRYNRSAGMVRYDTVARNVSIHFPMAYSVVLWSLYLLYLLSGLHMDGWMDVAGKEFWSTCTLYWKVGPMYRNARYAMCARETVIRWGVGDAWGVDVTGTLVLIERIQTFLTRCGKRQSVSISRRTLKKEGISVPWQTIRCFYNDFNGLFCELMDDIGVVIISQFSPRCLVI